MQLSLWLFSTKWIGIAIAIVKMGAQPMLEPDGNHSWNRNCIINHRCEWTHVAYSHHTKVGAMRRRLNNRQKRSKNKRQNYRNFRFRLRFGVMWMSLKYESLTREFEDSVHLSVELKMKAGHVITIKHFCNIHSDLEHMAIYGVIVYLQICKQKHLIKARNVMNHVLLTYHMIIFIHQTTLRSPR